jgi:Tfp pilus assembly protein PilN
MNNAPHVKINLVGKNKVSFTNDFLKWATNAGRIIIVITELVVLGALAYRFTLDAKIIDLHDKIKKSELFVQAQSAKEQEYRSIQTRLQNIKTVDNETNNKISIMNQILTSISKGDFASTNLTISGSTISINGVAFSIYPLNDFINGLKKDPNITSISLDDISSTAQGIQFKMTIELKNVGPNLTAEKI